jgi:hypothetical protein
MNIAKEVAVLERLTVKQLQGRYAEAFDEQTNANHKAWLVKRIAWRLQAQTEGDLSERARQRAAELANDADLRLSPPKMLPGTAPATTLASIRPDDADRRLPLPGTIITRTYKGRTLLVKVLPAGFEFEGEFYKSLSAVARAASGQHMNGYLFFRLGKEAVR